MLRVEELTNRTFATTRRGDGYEVAEVDRFRADVAEALTMRDSLISKLHVELDARPQPGDANPDRADAEACRRESSLAAARLLEMATVNADQLVSDSRAEAESVLSAARAEADELRRSSHAEAERVAAELERRREQQTAELDRHRTTVLTELEDQRAGLEAQIETLRQMESDHRERLRRHLVEHLARLDDSADHSKEPAAHLPDAS